jgi:hypothetical protein
VQPHGTLHTSNQSPTRRQRGTSAIASSQNQVDANDPLRRPDSRSTPEAARIELARTILHRPVRHRPAARRTKRGEVVRYLQLAHNERNERGVRVARVIRNFGREDELDREALVRLVRSIQRFLGSAETLRAQAPEGFSFVRAPEAGGRSPARVSAWWCGGRRAATPDGGGGGGRGAARAVRSAG